MAALAVALVVAVSGLGDGRGQVSQEVDPEAATLATAGESQVGPPPPPGPLGAPGYEEVFGMAAREGTVVAVGHRAAGPRNQGPRSAEPLAWWSTDEGRQWHAASPPGEGTLTSVAAVADGFLAVGRVVDDVGIRAVVLGSGDGRQWVEKVVPGLADVMLEAVVTTPRGPILAGYRVATDGREPFAIGWRASTGWRQAVLPGRVAGSDAEIHGGCVSGDDVVLVGRVIGEDRRRAPLVLRSADAGDTWRPVQLPDAAVAGRNARASGCAFASGSLAVVGATQVDRYDRAFVSVETKGGEPALSFLDPPGRQLSETIANGVVWLGSDLVVVGQDASLDGLGDLAVWHGGPDRWVRLQALDELGSGGGVGAGYGVLVMGGVVVVGGTSSDRAVVWRSSPARAQQPRATPPPGLGSGKAAVVPGDPTAETWLAAYGRIDACALADPELLRTVMGAEPVISPISDPAELVIECRWRPADGNRLVTIQVTPAHRLDTFESTYPSVIPSLSATPGICEDARYYGAVLTAIARCGEMAVAVGGLPQEEATVLLRAVAGRFRS